SRRLFVASSTVLPWLATSSSGHRATYSSPSFSMIPVYVLVRICLRPLERHKGWDRTPRPLARVVYRRQTAPQDRLLRYSGRLPRSFERCVVWTASLGGRRPTPSALCLPRRRSAYRARASSTISRIVFA